MPNGPSSYGSQEVAGFLEAIELYHREGLTDGLPIIPPTPELVTEFLAHAHLEPDHVVGRVEVGDRSITAEKIAVNAVMAGCLPEYMPVLIAGVEAMTRPEFGLHSTAASTSGASHMLIVGGPIARELDVNHGANVFGPTKRANAAIGRAIRLIIMNVCEARPGVLDRSTVGNPGKYTACIAEDEELTPWLPLRCDFDYPVDESAVTAIACYAPVQVSDHLSKTPEEVLDNLARSIVHYPYYARGGQILVVIVPEHLRIIHGAGWSKEEVKEHLFQATTMTVSFWERIPNSGKHDYGVGVDSMSVVDTPDDFLIMVAGGGAGGFSTYLVSWGSEVDYSRAVTRSVASP